MNIDGGSISFDTTFETGAIARGLKTTENLVKNFTSLTVKSGTDVDTVYKKLSSVVTKGFEAIGNSIQINETAIANLQKKYTDLKDAADKAFGKGNDSKYNSLMQQLPAIQMEISQREKTVKKLYEQDDALVKLNAATEEHKQKLDSAKNAQVRFRTELLNVKQKLMELAEAGKQNTAEYVKMEEEAKRLTNALYTANQQIKILTSVKGETLQGLVSGISGLTGAFTTAQGAMGLFASQSEDLQKIMLKVQSLMSITMGLQAVNATLHKDSAFRLTILTKAKAAYAVSIYTVGKAFIKMGAAANVARIAARSLMAIATGGLGVAITFLVDAISKFTEKSSEAKEMMKKISESAGDQIASLMKLSTQWKSLGDNITAQKKFLRENSEEIKKLTGETLNLSQADNLFIRNTKKFIEALVTRARAEVQYDKVKEKTRTLNEIDTKLETVPEKVTKRIPIGQGAFVTKEQENPEYAKLSEKRKTVEKEAEALLAQHIKFADREKKILEDLGLSSREILEGSIAAIEQTISELKNRYKNATTDIDRQNLETQIREQEKLLAKIENNPSDKSAGKHKADDPFLKSLEEKKKQYQEYLKWATSTDENVRESAEKTFATLLKDGGSYKEYLNNQADSLRKLENAGKITAEQSEKLRKLTSELQEETGKTIMQEFENSLQEEMSKANSLMDMLAIIEQKREELKTDAPALREQKSDVLDKHQTDIAKKANDDYNKSLKEYSDYLDSKLNAELKYFNKKKDLEMRIEKETDAERKKILQKELNTLTLERQTAKLIDFDALLTEYSSFSQKKLDIDKEYQENKQMLEEQITGSEISPQERIRAEDALKELEKTYKQTLSNLSAEVLQHSDAWQELFTNLDALTVSKMLELKNKITDAIKDSPDLLTESVRELLKQLDGVTEKIRSKNPFAALGDAIKTYQKDQNSVNLENVVASSNAIAGEVKSIWSEGLEIFKEMGGEMDEQTESMLNDIFALQEAGGQLAMGIVTGNPVQIIQGSIGVLKAGMSLLNSGAAARNRMLEQEIERSKNLVEIYGELLDKQKKLIETTTVKEAIGAYEKSLGIINKQQESAAQALSSWFASGAGMFSHSHGYKFNKDGYGIGTSDVFNYNATDWENFKESLTETWERLPQQVKDYANAVIAAKDETAALGDTMKDAVTGFSLDEVTGGIMDMVGQADLAFTDIADSFETHMKTSILNLVRDKSMSLQLEQWYQSLTDAITGDGELSSDETARLQKEYEDIVNEALEKRNYMAKIAGISFESDESAATTENNTLAGAMKGISQEQAEIIAGSLNAARAIEEAMRAQQLDSIEIMRDQLLHLASIDMKISASNQHLESIDNKMTHSGDSLRAQGITTY